MPRTASFINWNNALVMGEEVFTYDALNRPVTVTQPDNTVVTDIYDKGGLLKQVLHNSTQHIANITYNPRGQRENVYYGNNTKTRYYYNPLNFRLTRILTTRNNGQDILQDLNYSYDAVGNITSQTDNAQQTFYFNNQVIAPTGSYQYDALYRLLQATGRELLSLGMPTHNDFINTIHCPNPASNAMQNYTQYYSYDTLGNILNVTSQGSWSRDYIYATATNRLLRHTQQLPDTYSYDAHGNMLVMPHLSNMSWDYLDQLHSATNGTFVSYYNYDAEGTRTRKVTEKGNITEIRYYIGNYELYQKYVNGSLDFEQKTINISDDEKVFVRIETKTGENPVIRYQYDNHLGSACLELDNSGQIISYEEYHPFGTTSYRSGRNETEVSLKRYKYCGKERDEETGLYYYGMRYYAAWLCRFVSVDPLQFQYPYYTPYQYAGNKPVSYIDLDGGEEADPRTGKIQGTTYLRFDIDLSQEEKNAYMQKVKQNITDTWGNGQHQYNGMTVTVDDLEVKEASADLDESNLKSGESLLLVGTGTNAKEETRNSKVSYVNEDRKTGYMYYENEGIEAGHELGHILGLADRYIRLLKYNDQGKLRDAGSLPLYLKKDFSYDNLMSSGGNNLTQKQLSIVFNHEQERVHRTPVVITGNNLPNGDGLIFKINGNKTILGKLNSKNEFYSVPGKYGNVRLVFGLPISYGLGERFPTKFVWTANKSVINSNIKEIRKSNYNLIKFFNR